MQSRKFSILVRWLISLLIVIGVHIGFFAMLIIGWASSLPNIQEVPAAIMVELSPLIEAPNNTPQENPSPVTQEISNSTPIEPEPINEHVPPVETPKTTLAIIKPKPKPIEKQKKIINDTSSNSYAESNTAATSHSISDRVTVPEKTVSTLPSKAQITWQSRLLAHIARYKRYPLMARNKRQQGNVFVSFTIDAQGKVSNKRIVKSSGYAPLDQEVMDLLDRAQPLPLPPADVLNGKTARAITIPINFNLKDKY